MNFSPSSSNVSAQQLSSPIISLKILKKVDWGHDYYIEITLWGSMATFDDNKLTVLVVLAHAKMLRVEIKGIGPGYMRLIFHQRSRREGGHLWERCPALADHVKMIEEHYNIK